MPTKTTWDKIHWFITILTALFVIPAFVISVMELGESKIANRLLIEPYIDIVGQNKPKPKEFHFMINNLGKVDVKDIYYEYIILSRHGANNEFRKHIHGSNDLDVILRAGKKMTFKIELDDYIFPKKILIDPIIKVIIDPIVFIGLKIKYKREIDSRPFQDTFYYYTYPNPTETNFASGPIKLENMSARLWWDAVKEIDNAFQSF